ncbi:YceI family protein [Parahaliea sp. F7430]|uniref:YceI family protein n=1 Tax=Sediminihaliea albiluteola TaxID=2758564 RepID=A0A7W2TXQ0_9GAMM|nr:YceI family protein [Sediminihaliea albiluteola]MBA6413863.1 YceI family protein [Sediminihaliea albiluteola]
MMNTKTYFGRLVLGLFLSIVAAAANAQWELNNSDSSLNFISIKNGGGVEAHSFDTLFGFIDQDGAAQLSIDLDSVNTAIELRDERMRSMLFETAMFPAAKVNAQIEPAILEALEPGAVVTSDIEVSLSLHGVEANVRASVVIISEAGGLLRVLTTQPILLQATDFNLGQGVAALQKAAGLASISTTVPVSFHLVFQSASE